MKLAKVLNDAQIRSLSRQPGMWAVGVVSGLVLQVSPDGAASWVLRATYGGRVRSMGLGPYREVSLKQARELAAQARALIREGRDRLRNAQRQSAP
jgi:Arm DNA-binding domain